MVTEEGYVGVRMCVARRGSQAAGRRGQVLVELVDGGPGCDAGTRLGRASVQGSACAPAGAATTASRSSSRFRSVLQNDLPAPATAFLGREKELDQMMRFILPEAWES